MGLVAWDNERYGSLSHPGDSYSYDIFSRAERAVGPDREHNGVDPMGGLKVRNLIATGWWAPRSHSGLKGSRSSTKATRLM